MARKITMFELYFDGAHFGPSVPEASEEDLDDEMDADYDEMASGSSMRPALAAVGAIAVVSAAGFLAARRFRGGDDGDFGFDEPDHGHVEIGEAEESDELVAN